MTAGRQLEHAEARADGPARRRVHLLAHDLERPDNVGSLFRLADALGVAHLHLTGATPAPPHPRIRKLARATERAVAWSHAVDPGPVLDDLEARAITLVALERTTRSVDVAALGALEGPLCLVLGRERAGVAPELLTRCAGAYHVPMRGQNSSMNVAMAAAIAVYAATRAGPVGDLRASPQGNTARSGPHST